MPDTDLATLATRQHHIVTRAQLLELGVSRHRVKSELRARRWQALGPRVVALRTGELSREQRWWTAVLHTGPLSALCGRSAAEAAGLTGWRSEHVHVVVPRSSKVSGYDDVVIHESRRFDPSDRHPGRELPQTRIERSLVDAACWSRDRRTACGLLAAGVQQRLTTATRLRRTLLAQGQVRHRRLLLATLGDIEGGSQALSEIDLVRLCRRHGLPIPDRQVVRRDPQGRIRYLDAEWQLPDGRVVVAEIDGAVHLLVLNYWQDMMRANEFGIAGDVVLRFPSLAIRTDDPVAIDQLSRALLPPSTLKAAG